MMRSLARLSAQVWDVLTANLRFPLGGGGVRDKRRINALYVRPPLLAEDAAAAAPWPDNADEQPQPTVTGLPTRFDAADAARIPPALSPLESLVYPRRGDTAAALAGALGAPPVLSARAAGSPAAGGEGLGSTSLLPAAEAPARSQAVLLQEAVDLSQEAVAMSREGRAAPASSLAAPAPGAVPPSQAAMAAPVSAVALSQAAVATPGSVEAASERDLLMQKDPWDTIVRPSSPCASMWCNLALPLAEPGDNITICKTLHATRHMHIHSSVCRVCLSPHYSSTCPGVWLPGRLAIGTRVQTLMLPPLLPPDSTEMQSLSRPPWNRHMWWLSRPRRRRPRPPLYFGQQTGCPCQTTSATWTRGLLPSRAAMVARCVLRHLSFAYHACQLIKCPQAWPVHMFWATGWCSCRLGLAT